MLWFHLPTLVDTRLITLFDGTSLIFFLTRFLNSSSSILRCVGVCAQIALYYYGYSQSKNPPFLRLCCSSGLHGLLLVEAGLCTGWIIPPPFKTTGNLSVCESHVIRNKSALNNWLVFVIVVSNRFLSFFFEKKIPKKYVMHTIR